MQGPPWPFLRGGIGQATQPQPDCCSSGGRLMIVRSIACTDVLVSWAAPTPTLEAPSGSRWRPARHGRRAPTAPRTRPAGDLPSRSAWPRRLPGTGEFSRAKVPRPSQLVGFMRGMIAVCGILAVPARMAEQLRYGMTSQPWAPPYLPASAASRQPTSQGRPTPDPLHRQNQEACRRAD